LDLNLRKKLLSATFGAKHCMVMKLRYLECKSEIPES
jgi:hypothetical protein